MYYVSPKLKIHLVAGFLDAPSLTINAKSSFDLAVIAFI